MRLTEPQVRELRRLAKEPQPTFGKARVRVQNNLHQLGLAIVGVATCHITEMGRAALRAHDAVKSQVRW